MLETIAEVVRKRRAFYEEQHNRLYYSLAAFASMKKCLAKKLGPTQEIRIQRECYEYFFLCLVKFLRSIQIVSYMISLHAKKLTKERIAMFMKYLGRPMVLISKVNHIAEIG